MAGEVRNRRGRLTGNPGKVIRQFNFEGALGPTKTFIGKTGWIQLDLLGFLHVISLDFTGGGEMHVFGTGLSNIHAVPLKLIQILYSGISIIRVLGVL